MLLLGIVEHCWVLEVIGPSNIQQHPTISSRIHAVIMLDMDMGMHVGWWMWLDVTGCCWVLLDAVGCCWNLLDVLDAVV